MHIKLFMVVKSWQYTSYGCDPGWVASLVVVEDVGQWGRRQKQQWEEQKKKKVSTAVDGRLGTPTRINQHSRGTPTRLVMNNRSLRPFHLNTYHHILPK